MMGPRQLMVACLFPLFATGCIAESLPSSVTPTRTSSVTELKDQGVAEADPGVIPTQTEIDVWGPGLSSAWWSQIVATVVTSNDDWTSYCAFCRTDIEIPCTLPDGSFTFGLGTSTFFLSTPLPSSQTRTLECQLDGTTIATCLQSQGEDQDTVTSTYSGSNLEWGLLTLGERPNSLPTLELTTDAITDEAGHTIHQTDTRVTSTPTASENTSPNSMGTASISRSGNGMFMVVSAACIALAIL
ncbi:hypothetical protein MKZ38_000350 [Zalerion maritima]|uniref:Uncharacterized protein n=1 Tax=Zalerion maritima TaxID=339359 RepID=A0AAD5RZH9_9PEZI|nr:hypothetical protein MKZ38_000350 [Zalerion maritima]